MRTIPATETNLATSPNRAVRRRVRVSDEGASPWIVDLSDHCGHDWIHGITVEHRVDQPVATAVIKLRRAYDWLTIMPGRASQANLRNGSAADVLVENKLVIVEALLLPMDSAPPSGATWTELFRGRVEKIDPGGSDAEYLTLTCRDLAGELVDTFIESEQGPLLGTANWYTAITWPINAEDFLQALVDNVMPKATGAWVANTAKAQYEAIRPTTRNGFYYWVSSAGGTTHATTEPTWPTYIGGTVVDGTVTWTCRGRSPIVYLDGAPGWAFNEPPKDGKLVTKEPLFGLMRKLTESFGGDLRYVWHAGSSSWRLTLFDPNRTTLDPDVSFASTFYAIASMERAITNRRNAIQIVYSDKTDGYKRKVYTAANDTAISQYGRRWAELCFAANDNINTLAEATDLGDKLLSDMGKPYWTGAVALPFYPYAELNDVVGLYESERPDRLFDGTHYFNVLGISHSLEGAKATTTLAVVEVDGFSMQYIPTSTLISRMARPGIAPAASFVTPKACSVLAYQGTLQTITTGATGEQLASIDTVSEDLGGNFNTANGKFTAPVAGGYVVFARVTLNAPPAGTAIDFWLEVSPPGSKTALVSTVVSSGKAGAAFQVELTAWLDLGAGDVVEAWVAHDKGSDLNTVAGVNNTAMRVLRMA